MHLLIVFFATFTIPIVQFKGGGGPAPPLVGVALWLKADAGVTVNSSNTVTVWADQSGHANNFTQPAGLTGTSLTQVLNAQNGLPVLRQDVSGGTCLSSAPFFTGSQSAEVMAVVKSNTSSINYAWANFEWSTTNASVHFTYGGTWYESWGQNARPPNDVGLPLSAYTNYNILNVVADPSAWTTRIAGSTYHSPRTVTIAWATDFSLFARDSSCAFVWAGDIGEILIWDHVLSTLERSQAYTYLQTRWSVP
jgi:hypothetical protein